jgi:hypothetical protein
MEATMPVWAVAPVSEAPELTLYAGQYLGALLYSVEGCRHVLRLLDALAEGKEVPVTLVTSERRPVQASWLKLNRGKLQQVQP